MDIFKLLNYELSIFGEFLPKSEIEQQKLKELQKRAIRIEEIKKGNFLSEYEEENICNLNMVQLNNIVENVYNKRILNNYLDGLNHRKNKSIISV